MTPSRIMTRMRCVGGRNRAGRAVPAPASDGTRAAAWRVGGRFRLIARANERASHPPADNNHHTARAAPQCCAGAQAPQGRGPARRRAGPMGGRRAGLPFAVPVLRNRARARTEPGRRRRRARRVPAAPPQRQRGEPAAACAGGRALESGRLHPSQSWALQASGGPRDYAGIVRAAGPPGNARIIAGTRCSVPSDHN